METAKLFKNGKNQAVRLPKEYNFNGDHVYIKRVGNAVILLPYHAMWDALVDSLALFSTDFMSERVQLSLQDREAEFSR